MATGRASHSRSSFEERQHTEVVPLFDRRATVSGVSCGEQGRLYDQRRAVILPQHGIRLVIIHTSRNS